MARIIEVDTALSVQDYSPEADKTVCLVIDVIRASTTIVSFLDNGCRRVYAVAEEEKARQLGAERQMLTAGEWKGIKLPGFDLDNSPAEARRHPIKGRDIVLCTSNGTRVIHQVKNCVKLFIASLMNAQACVQAGLSAALDASCGITIVCAGQYGKFVLDDAFCAGYLLQEMEKQAEKLGIELKESDACRAAKAVFKAYPDARTAFEESASGKVLLGTKGYEDFEVCLEYNTSQVVPCLQVEDDLIWFVNWEEQQ
ncbi:MAG TPA: 2-phosphosulfolactate phosphatase [Syntrophomonadaceae bacterium]|nr:2-phosphosulfolactate phosphatase [Syntrophomonadaceae bacterium]HOQ09871.1 2-phosphosulfolactate phosphatase [Syntrophomonadaceae bacterium]HPU48071.1 2-phosphosulfolactate phosphatase [Syntrophomonadaceae bacterium]